MVCTKAGNYRSTFEAFTCCSKYHVEDGIYYCDIFSTVIMSIYIFIVIIALCVAFCILFISLVCVWRNYNRNNSNVKSAPIV